MQTRWGGGVVWRKAAEERNVCLGVCVCEGWGRHYIVGLGAGGWEQLKSEVLPPPLPAEPHSCGLVCLRLLVNTAQLNTSSWCARPHCTAALHGAFRNRGHELRNKPRTVWCWKKFLKHCICVQDHSNLSSHHLWMRLIEIRHQTKSAVKPAVNNKKPNMHHQNSSRIKLVGAGWPWKRIFQYLPLLQHLSPVSMAAECRKQSYAAVSARLHSALQPLYFWKQHFRALPSSCTGEGARESEFDENLIKEIEEHEAKPCSHCCYFRLPSAATERPTRGFVSYVGGYSWMCLKRHF